MIYRIIGWSLIAFACFYGLGAYPLLDNNEGMYAAIARDMLKSSDFIIPHLNGVPYIEKPPLLFWLMAASMSIFGDNEFAARLIPALALFFTAWKLHRFLLRVTGSEQPGLIAALILTTSLPLLVMARMVMLDMLMTCFLSAALIFFYEWREKLHASGRGNRYLYGFYACLAFAVLTKGFVALILAGGTIAVFLLWQRRPFADYVKILSPVGIVLFLAIAAPWHTAASFKDPGFAYFYFINEHLLRFLNMRQPHDYYTGPIWYYLLRIPAYLLPWTLFLALLARNKGKWQITNGKNTDLPFDLCSLTFFLWSWFLFCLVFFSISGAKANYYMIAGMPPLVMLLALRLEDTIATNPRFVRTLASVMLFLIVGALGFTHYFCHEGVCQVISWPVIGLAGGYMLVAMLLIWRLPPRWTMPLLGANVLWLLPLLISGVTMAGDRVSQKPVADYLKNSGSVAIYQEFEQLSALSFYLDKPLIIVASYSSDLLYGKQHTPAASSEFISLAEWMAKSPQPPMVVLNKRLASVMTGQHNLCVLRQFDRVSVIKRCK